MSVMSWWKGRSLIGKILIQNSAPECYHPNVFRVALTMAILSGALENDNVPIGANSATIQTYFRVAHTMKILSSALENGDVPIGANLRMLQIGCYHPNVFRVALTMKILSGALENGNVAIGANVRMLQIGCKKESRSTDSTI
ncbi:hypothetical protein CEXT_286401 [Caerostris extrusa]|uniref:Uncharacterized protein n=1 Tax=Caerostris extrusa TaxID=172846 RepID=A0AAV4RY19_CAEEX|nr:hypothetical protein CEXT_286401 [Caerostris extrusa]